MQTRRTLHEAGGQNEARAVARVHKALQREEHAQGQHEQCPNDGQEDRHPRLPARCRSEVRVAKAVPAAFQGLLESPGLLQLLFLRELHEAAGCWATTTSV